MKDFCIKANQTLNGASKSDFAPMFIGLKRLFYDKYQNGLVFSTAHGVDFFTNVINCLDGQKWEEKGEYGNNFRKMIEMYWYPEI